ncbi:hypothetical protein [Aneurinibacillus terranovensis]|uniref:hypothetical protein n=1 Tax=Aneurinibacillus terranovensis TaxID=278991 RepID=UPI0004120298|nr:hypothetical protein [Aneurinibacillus terranovensis]
MKKWGYGLVGAVLAFTISGVSSGIAETLTPGSDNDPIVTKSYVDKIKADIENQISAGAKSTVTSSGVSKSYVDQIKAALENEIRASASGQGTGKTGGQASAGAGQLAVEKVPAGKVVVGYSGTEFIVRTGEAVAYTPAGDGYGLPDVTGGQNLERDIDIPLNHLILLPSNDNRGLKVVKGPSYIMIRGKYTIQ